LAIDSAATGNLPIDQVRTRPAAPTLASWTAAYQHRAILADFGCGLAAGLLAFSVRFGGQNDGRYPYLVLSLALPALWVAAVGMSGGYDSRFTGVGPEEFRRILSSGIFLTAAVAIVSYAVKADLARGYVVVALPTLTALDLLARFTLRKHLHRLRRDGQCMRKVVVVGHAAVAADLAARLRRDTYHGLSVVAACVAGPAPGDTLADLSNQRDETGIEIIPLSDELDNVVDTVERHHADTVAVLPYPEVSGVRLRELAWRLEKTGTDLCVAPALLDVAGPRTTIRPVDGLPLLHMDHPEFGGVRRLAKAGFDRAVAGVALVICSPLLLAVAAAVRLGDGRPVLFRQIRVGQDGRHFTLFKFRTMVQDAEQLQRHLHTFNESDGVLFKIRRDPRVTRVGASLRRWSLDELPQLINVLIGDMSLVGPRPALPQEAALYAAHVRRRLMVKPGMTGLWQVNGRSTLTWDEAVRLDLRYVENWSFVLDLQILWKTGSAVLRGSGAY
jgi:exopolysaccharide biosynthesis polyprenyl glycosylphosphotransferase